MIKLSTNVLAVVACLVPDLPRADILIAARTIRAQSVITPDDVAVTDGDMSGAAADPAEVVGQEARTSIYAGRPIRLADIGPPAVIERNEIVQIVFQKHGLQITTEGRSLDRAAPGDTVRVMNMSSRNTVNGWVSADGTVFVAN